MSWFEAPGAYVLVDGQFGSTGKGLLAAVLAEAGRGKITKVTTNAGPNSGHTAYWNGASGGFSNKEGYQPEKIMTQQVPVASVFLEKMGEKKVETIINAGAIIDQTILAREIEAYLDYRRVLIHPNAAVIDEVDREYDQKTVSAIASTGKGTGPAAARKLLRHDYGAVAGAVYHPQLAPEGFPGRSWDNLWDWRKDVVFVETAQGFSLGLNTARFFPNVTSRECTVMQALADARIPAQALRRVAACYRTFPIRVGNTENSSGGCYEDQREITWEEVGVEPELTSVTKRVRRVFTWSDIQYRESLAANRPDLLFFNFMNYLSEDQRRPFIKKALMTYFDVMGCAPEMVMVGMGPYVKDVQLVQTNRTIVRA